MRGKGIKNKGIIIALIVFFIILIGGIIAFPHFKSGFTGATSKVYQLKNDIPAKTQITKDMLKEVAFPEEFIQDKNSIVTDENDIINSYSKINISKNDLITKDKITNKSDEALYSKGNLLAVTVSTLSSSVAGKIYPGDFVKIYAYVKQERQTPDGDTVNIQTTISPKELEKIEVAYILTSQAQDTTATDEKNKSNIIPNVVVLKITDENQAKSLVNLEYSGKIHLEKIND